jgi:hypothetical protein
MKCSECIGITKYENIIITIPDVQAWKQNNRQGLVTLLVSAVKDEYYIPFFLENGVLVNALNTLLG